MAQTFRFASAGAAEPLPVVPITLEDEMGQTTALLNAVVDTGADGTVVPLQILRQAGFRPNRQRKFIRTANAAQTPEVALGYALKLMLGSLMLTEVDVYGSREFNEVILGRNVLNRLRFTYDGPNLIVTIEE